MHCVLLTTLLARIHRLRDSGRWLLQGVPRLNFKALLDSCCAYSVLKLVFTILTHGVDIVPSYCTWMKSSDDNVFDTCVAKAFVQEFYIKACGYNRCSFDARNHSCCSCLSQCDDKLAADVLAETRKVHRLVHWCIGSGISQTRPARHVICD